MTTNIFVLIVATKGAGKTPSSKTFMVPLLNLEKEEMDVFDEMCRASKKSKKRKRQSDEGDSVDKEATEEDVEIPEKKKETNDREQFRFHPKTRVCDQITPEALIMALSSGDGVMLINSDEFKVIYT